MSSPNGHTRTDSAIPGRLDHLPEIVDALAPPRDNWPNPWRGDAAICVGCGRPFAGWSGLYRGVCRNCERDIIALSVIGLRLAPMPSANVAEAAALLPKGGAM